jgi:hypothetical protein
VLIAELKNRQQTKGRLKQLNSWLPYWDGKVGYPHPGRMAVEDLRESVLDRDRFAHLNSIGGSERLISLKEFSRTVSQGFLGTERVSALHRYAVRPRRCGLLGINLSHAKVENL